jgi:hypothetical protein
MKIYYVEYRLGDDWRADMPFNSLTDAERYLTRQIELAKMNLAGSLNEFAADDFRITEMQYEPGELA